MALLQKSFSLDVLTPLGRECGLVAVSAVFPASDGKVGVLSGRAPLVAIIGAGELAVQTAEGRGESFYITGGFAHVREGGMTVLAEQCIPVGDLDAEQAWDQLQQAKRIPVETLQDWAARDKAVERARAKFNLAQRQRRKAMRA